MPPTFATFQLGDGVKSRVTIRDSENALFDPTTVVLLTKNPAGVEEEVTPTKISTGIYEAVFVLDVAGTWSRRWKATGNAYAADEVKIRCQPTAFTAP